MTLNLVYILFGLQLILVITQQNTHTPLLRPIKIIGSIPPLSLMFGQPPPNVPSPKNIFVPSIIWTNGPDMPIIKLLTWICF